MHASGGCMFMCAMGDCRIGYGEQAVVLLRFGVD